MEDQPMNADNQSINIQIMDYIITVWPLTAWTRDMLFKEGEIIG